MKNWSARYMSKCYFAFSLLPTRKESWRCLSFAMARAVVAVYCLLIAQGVVMVVVGEYWLDPGYGSICHISDKLKAW